MNYIFRPYPSHAWFSDWTFEPNGCSSAYREKCQNQFFRSVPTVGQIVPHVEVPTWALQVPVPQNSRINMLANGFCGYFERRKIKCGAEAFCPEPGVLWGRFSEIPPPVLLSEYPGETFDDGQWIETDTLNAYLVVRNNIFCLVSTSNVLKEARELADAYLRRNLEEHLVAEYTRRSNAMTLFEGMGHHDSLAAICVESMMKALRPAEGRIPHIWSQSSSSDAPRFDINEVFPLACAWRRVDPSIAEELILCVLKIQTNAGAIPVHFSPHTTYSVMEAPKPLLVKTAEMVWETRKDPDFLKTVIPMLRRHLQWQLHHFDPKRRGHYSWKNQHEPLVPDLYQTDLETIDLTILLLTEIEALDRLRKQSPDFSSSPTYFEEERDTIRQSVVDLFWNENDNAFTHAYLRSNQITVRGFPELTPLLWKGLDQTHKTTILDYIGHSETLPGQFNVLSWRQSSLDDHEFPLLQQFLIFHALQSAAPQSALLSDFSRLTVQGFVEWHTVTLDAQNPLHIKSAHAAYILDVQAMHKYRYYAKNNRTGSRFQVLGKMRIDRTDLIVIATTLLAILCIHLLYDARGQPPALITLEAQMKSAYAERDGSAVIRNSRAIMELYPEESDLARLLAGNILMLNGQFSQAGAYFTELREKHPDSPGPMVSLGLSMQLQGRMEAAESSYAEFCYLFDIIFPEAVQEVNTFRFGIQEGLPRPAKWQEIYRYAFMHQL